MAMPIHERVGMPVAEDGLAMTGAFNAFFLVAAFIGFASAVTYIVAYSMSKKDKKQIKVELEK